METTFIALALLTSFSAFAAPVTSEKICGAVVYDENGDMDYTSIKFFAKNLDGSETQYGLMNGGMILCHDYDVVPNGINKMKGLTLCIDSSKISRGFGLIDVRDLEIAK